jgi:transglutaminase-like putative cysteine protease
VSTSTYEPKGAGTDFRGWLGRRVPELDRGLALLGTAALLGASLQVLYYIVDVAGDPSAFWFLVGIAFVAATALASVLRVRTAVVLGLGVLTVGLTWYVLSLPYDPRFTEMLASNLELLSGQSLLSIERAPIWALSVTPGPVFVTWFLALRRWYTTAVVVGSATLAYFVLTTDAGTTITLVGVVGGAAAVGFGDLDRRPGTGAAREYVAIVLAAMIIVPALVSVVPGGAGVTLSLTDDEETEGTLEAGLLSTGGDMDLVGSIELSPEVRFTVEAETPRRWRIGTYDRYTGSGWVRSGGSTPLEDTDLSSLDGPSERLVQRYEAESSLDVLPAAWRPVALSGAPTRGASVAKGVSVDPASPLRPGDSYRVVSSVPDADAETLRAAGRDYPGHVEDYLQLPNSTPDRVREKTDRLTAEASNPYDTARTVETWLERNRDYSLEVEDPGRNVADSFLFEMRRGYCTYYATTMAVMLRTQDVPARVVVGYTPGQPLEGDEFLVRGYNSHAWVEVYFPEQGWVAFDPTPASPRETAEQAQLEEARAEGAMPVDTAGSAPETTTTPPPTRTVTPNAEGETPAAGDFAEQIREDAAAGGDANAPEGDGGEEGDGGVLPPLPSRREMALIAVALVGLVAGVRRTGAGRRAVRAVWLRYQPRRDPTADVERAYRRALTLLETEHRERADGETPRQFFDAVDAGTRFRQVLEARERARHGGGVDEATADEVVELTDRLVAERGW